MTQISKESRPIEVKPVTARSSLPWWTWVLPFFVAHLGTWLSIWFKTDPGASLWYLPTAFGIVMAYWWGPRVLLGVYLNAVVCTPLWDLPWQWSFLYALPETLEVGLSWLLFIKLARGKYWLPDLRNVGSFLLFGSLLPTFIANVYLVMQLYFLRDIPETSIWGNWMVVFSADLATQYVFAVPVLVLFTRSVMESGSTELQDNIPQLPFLPAGRSTLLDKVLLVAVFAAFLAMILLFPVNEVRGVYGLLMIFIAIRYGMIMAILSSTWVGLLAFLLPALLKGNLGLSTASGDGFLTGNFDILFLCGVTLVTGRAVSDLFTEINERKQSEENLRRAEAKFRTLVEQIPPIIYIAGPEQHIGVTYISPQINSLGFTQDEWIADSELWFRQILPEDQPKVLDDIEQSVASGKPFRSEYRLKVRDGKLRWFLDEAMYVADKDGTRLFVQGFMLDITERKQMEEALSSHEHYLELLNGLTRTILLSRDWNSTLQTLAFDLKELIGADDCYILSWDEEKQLPIPIATTAKLDFSFPGSTIGENEVGITMSVLQIGRVLTVDDVRNSPHIDINIARRFPAHSVIAIPLIAGGHKLGAAIIAYNTPHEFTRDEIERAEQAGNQIALALWTFRQSLEIQQRLKESNTLAKIERALSETEHIGTGEVLQLIVDSARELMPHAERSVIHLLETEEQTLVAHAVSGSNEHEKEHKGIKMRLGEGVAGYVIREGVTVNVGNISTNPQFLLSASPPTFQSLMVAPVQSGGWQIGTISVHSTASNAFSSRDAELLNALAVQSAIAIENTRLFETTQQRLKEVNILYQISRGLAASLDADQLIRDVIALLQQSFGYYHVQIYLIDPESRGLVIRHGSGYIGSELVQQGYHIPAGEGIVSHVAETGEPFMTNNVDEVVFYKRNPLLSQTQYEIAVPIKVDEQVMGVLDIQQTPDHNRFTSSDLHLMTAIADHLAVVLQKANLYSTLQTSLQQEKQMRSQLLQSERLALVGRLLASVSHELNNPLQAIQYGLFLLRDETNLSDQARQDTDVLIAETERMTALIASLRSAYRPVRLKDFQPIPLNSLIEDVHALTTTYMRHSEIVFEFVPASDLPSISGLPDQIRQVILNLFLNAIDVMKPGGCLTVETRYLPQQKEVLLIVKDTGPGIDSEILPRIFDAFITNKDTGTGLGLTITHDIIQQHHGRIEVENDPEAGAIFKVWLPVEEGGRNEDRWPHSDR